MGDVGLNWLRALYRGVDASIQLQYYQSSSNEVIIRDTVYLLNPLSSWSAYKSFYQG
jgi:hypothetical protein